LYFCVHQMTATETNGTLVEIIHNTWKNDSNLDGSLPNQQIPNDYEVHSKNSSFTVDWNAASVLGLWLADLLKGNVTIKTGFPDIENVWNSVASTSNEIESILLSMNSSSTGFPKLMDRMAASLTWSLRNLPDQPAKARGTSYIPVTIILVDWLWLTLPLALLFLGFLFLLAVIIQSRRQNVIPWKNNVLAIIFHGPDRADLATYYPPHLMNEMEDVARRLSVDMQDVNGSRNMRLISGS